VELISAAIDFSEISAQEVMTARVDLLAIDVDDSWEEIMETIEASSYSRIPVYEDSIDNIIGILSLNHLLKALIDHETVDIRALLLPACYVYKTMKLPAVLSQLRDSRQHLAVVTDEYGGTLGVVSMEDVMEELVGDIWDETDTVETDVVEKADGLYEIDGDMVTSELVELMGWDEDEFDFVSDTVGGWCIEMLDGFPEPGDSFEYMGSEVRVLEMDERRVLKVQVKRSSADPEE
jgi:CBS domain containing-hemolysin-like protein